LQPESYTLEDIVHDVLVSPGIRERDIEAFALVQFAKETQRSEFLHRLFAQKGQAQKAIY
jgi:hypothetical protein